MSDHLWTRVSLLTTNKKNITALIGDSYQDVILFLTSYFLIFMKLAHDLLPLIMFKKNIREFECFWIVSLQLLKSSVHCRFPIDEYSKGHFFSWYSFFFFFFQIYIDNFDQISTKKKCISMLLFSFKTLWLVSPD